MIDKFFDAKLKNALRIDRALRFVWQASPLYSLYSGCVVIVLGILPLINLYFLKLIIDSITRIAIDPSNELLSRELSTPLLYILLACGIGLLTALFNFIADYLKKVQSLTVADFMFSAIHEKSIQTDLEYYESARYRDILYRAQQEGPYRPANIMNGLFNIGQASASFISVFLLLLWFNPFLPVLMVCASIPGLLMRVKYSEKMYTWHDRRTEDERRSHYFHYMLTSGVHAKEIRLFNLGKHFIKQFNTIKDTLKKEKLYFEKKRALSDFMAQALMIVSVFGSLVYITYKTAQGHISLGDMVMYFQAFQRGLTYLKTTLESGAQMYEDNIFLSHLYEFFSFKPAIKDPGSPAAVPTQLISGIELKNITFFYPDCEKEVIKNVNLFIKPGEKIALVGENGSGKSTLVKLLCRLYDPQKGKISIDGVDVKNYSLNDLRNCISVVFQDHNRYNLAVKENISLGDIKRKEDFDNIMRSAENAGIQKKIEDLPRQYETVLGRWFKKGEELSFGQWQLLAIARAFFKNAPFIILDEPSSALDPKAENHLIKKMKTLIAEKSALIISHRFSTVKMADTIVVLKEGQIIESGTHNDLLKLKGEYHRLYTDQANNYIAS